MKFKDLLIFLREGVQSYAPLGVMLGLAQALSRVLTLLQAPQTLAVYLQGAINDKYIFLLVLNIILFLLGMVLDVGPAIMILSPMLLPFAVSLGIDPVHLGIIMTCNLAVGMVTPPFGMNLFVASPMIKENPMRIGKEALPFIGFYVIALLIITYVPQLTMYMIG